MRFIRAFLAAIMLMTVAPFIESNAGGANTGGSTGGERLRGFLLAVADYYRVSRGEVMIIRERGIPPYEIPVVLFIAKRAHVEPEIIMDFRLSGNTWLDIALRFRLGPEIFYIPVRAVASGPPYGRAYGTYKNKAKKERKTIVLSDDDVVNLLNLKFMSEHYNYPPEKIMKMLRKGKEFVFINDEIRKERGRMSEHGEKKDGPKVERGKEERN